jgi:hypothetical protein
MRVLIEEGGGNKPALMLLLGKAENDALVTIVAGFLKTKPNKRSAAYKLAYALDGELLA